jgi:hypothetical protein
MSTGIELGRPIEILLVEDSPTDAALTMEALTANGLQNYSMGKSSCSILDFW